MKRRKRAASKRGRKRGAVIVDIGRLLEADPNYGLRVECYACGKRHKAIGSARIWDARSPDVTIHVPLCEPCVGSDDSDKAILRKYLNAPGLAITEGGEATTAQIEALANKQNATEH